MDGLREVYGMDGLREVPGMDGLREVSGMHGLREVSRMDGLREVSGMDGLGESFRMNGLGKGLRLEGLDEEEDRLGNQHVSYCLFQDLYLQTGCMTCTYTCRWLKDDTYKTLLNELLAHQNRASTMDVKISF
jgi:hypothetical protein